MTNVAVIYLDRKGNPSQFARRFLRQLRQRQAGAAYDLIYVLKGYGSEDVPAYLKQHQSYEKLAGQDMRVVRVSDDMFPLGISASVAAELEHKYVLMLWSWSRLESDNWLAYYMNAFIRVPNCGIVGASGSFEAMPGETKFPNVHIRTTAFMMEREVFLAMASGRQATYRDEFLLEAGSDSLTRQVIATGKQVVVVGRDGAIYRPEEWPGAGIFRSLQQKNLLISDKQTHLYDRVNLGVRQMIAQQAWGEMARPEKGGLLGRVWAVMRWRYAWW